MKLDGKKWNQHIISPITFITKMHLIHIKLLHYNTVLNQNISLDQRYFISNKKGDIENTEKMERKIMRKILGPKLTDEQHRL